MDRNERQEARRKEALRDIERIGETSEVVGTSAFRRAAQGTLEHFSANDAAKDDWAELWGRRIGRGLSVVIVVVLVIHLLNTYVLS